MCVYILKKKSHSTTERKASNFILLWAFEECSAQFPLHKFKRSSKIVLDSADHELLLLHKTIRIQWLMIFSCLLDCTWTTVLDQLRSNWDRCGNWRVIYDASFVKTKYITNGFIFQMLLLGVLKGKMVLCQIVNWLLLINQMMVEPYEKSIHNLSCFGLFDSPTKCYLMLACIHSGFSQIVKTSKTTHCTV